MMNYIKLITLYISLPTILWSCINNDVPKPLDDPEYKQLFKEVEAIDAYLKTNHNSSYIAYSNSGVRILVKKFGNDAPARKGQTINFTYIAKSFGTDSLIYDSQTKIDLLENISVVGLSGWLTSLQPGSISRVFIPSRYAFGSSSSGPVNPNTTVMFDVTINGVTKSITEQAQFNLDTATIKKITSTISGIIHHPSGISYTLTTTTGNGKFPKIYDNVSFDFKGSLISNGNVFSSNSINNTNIFSLIDGLRIGIPLMNEGSKAIFYIPSTLGYGTSGANLVPANSNIKFEITLNSIVTSTN